MELDSRIKHDLVVAKWRAGMACNEIARNMRVAYHKVYAVLQAAGIDPGARHKHDQNNGSAKYRLESIRAARACGPEPEHGSGVTFRSLPWNGCRFPTGFSAARGHLFCGEPKIDGRPYCAHHAKVARRPPNEFERRAAKIDRKATA